MDATRRPTVSPTLLAAALLGPAIVSVPFKRPARPKASAAEVVDRMIADRFEEAPPAPGRTIRGQAQPARRNAPCPCGSGRKYKSCCRST